MTLATRIAAAATALLAIATPGLALTITATFDSSITSQSNAASIEAGFRQAESNIDQMFATPVTVNINVSWGSVAGQALASNALGSSITSLYGYYGYSTIKSLLNNSAKSVADRSAYASLPSSAPAGESRYVVTSAQAKALGVVNPTNGVDGSIGFGAGASYSFTPGSVAPGTYDFVAVAEHEISEIMGRISGLNSAAPGYATIEDLFRFTGAGSRSWAYDGSAYFSIDNGATDLANFNHSSSGGDRADWLSSATTNDVADAFTSSGVSGVLSTLDQTVLDVLGWGSTGVGSGGASVVSTIKGAADASVPEPGSLSVLAFGGAVVGALAAFRRRRAPIG